MKSNELLEQAIVRLCGHQVATACKILDFGCGDGTLVNDLRCSGYQALGCDISADWQHSQIDPSFCKLIQLQPYRLPYEDATFDIVLSTSVLEHAQNKPECFAEMHRVLKPGGYAVHLFPAKWYLPTEPHIFVPLVNMMWPHVPRWWLGLWAWLGVRNQFQQGKNWREVMELNDQYCKTGLSYWSTGKYKKLVQSVFGNFSTPVEFYIQHASGGVARMLRKLPCQGISGALFREIRMSLIVMKKD